MNYDTFVNTLVIINSCKTLEQVLSAKTWIENNKSFDAKQKEVLSKLCDDIAQKLCLEI
jgi:hypothetical protein